MQVEYFGSGTLFKLHTIIAKHQAKRIFIVTGKQSFTGSGAKEILDTICYGCKTLIFNTFSVNPKLMEAISGIEMINSFHPELIVAVGGGSVLDMAKLITFLQAQSSDDYQSIIRQSGSDPKSKKKGLPLVAIPTTAGSGSEATSFAVVYSGGVKYSLTHSYILPDYAIVDPCLTRNISSYQAAVSGMDALCQGIESHWSKNATQESKLFSGEAIKVILKNIKPALLRGVEKAREEMALGANLAGKAINITQTTAPHAISYALTSRYGIPHGHAVALILGKFFTINGSHAITIADDYKREHLDKALLELYHMLGCRDGESCAKKWYQLLEEIGLELDFEKLGIISKSDHDYIADSVNFQRLKNHPVTVSRDTIKSLFD